MTKRSTEQLRIDVQAIWRAGVAAVDSERLVRENVRVKGGLLQICDHSVSLRDVRKIVVVGAGKAGRGMALGLEQALGEKVAQEKQLAGWVNAPADCVSGERRIHLHPGRPAGRNEPTAEGVLGARRILQMVSSLEANDLCIALVSGGGSALLPAPAEGISLADKQAVTRWLSAAGANIEELNLVRQNLSQIKGGGLARACNAGTLITLIISDVLGDPLDMIASGPTVLTEPRPLAARDILDRFGAASEPAILPIRHWLDARAASVASENEHLNAPPPVNRHFVIGNNAVAVDAAGLEAEKRGYSHAMTSAGRSEGAAENVGRHLAEMAITMLQQPGPDCLISGGEPTVKLAPVEQRGDGGRNQQLVLAALEELQNKRGAAALQGVALLSGGTDGEDGPTNAAGAFIDQASAKESRRRNLSPASYLERNDAYHFFEPLETLLLTGPTHTNVCDLRVLLVDRVETERRE